MTTPQHLERLALAAHQAGATWDTFWEKHGAEVCRAEPHDRQRFARLVRRLVDLVGAGDAAGADPAGVEKTTETANQSAS
jgi:hypothetical protein